eukprot:scaffold951_cov146-Amphora_coffeaeformis.AAC.4
MAQLVLRLYRVLYRLDKGPALDHVFLHDMAYRLEFDTASTIRDTGPILIPVDVCLFLANKLTTTKLRVYDRAHHNLQF